MNKDIKKVNSEQEFNNVSAGGSPKVSIFKDGFTANEPHNITVAEALNRIKTGKSKAKIDRIRALKTKKAQDKIKRQLPSVVFQGTFSHRENKSLIKASGIACMDFDHADDPEALKETIFADVNCFASWISPRGTGVKALFRIPEVNNDTEYKQYYNALLQRYDAPETDTGTKDVSRICYESYDPEILVRDISEAKIFRGVIVEPAKLPSDKDPNFEVTRDKTSKMPTTSEHWALKIAVQKIAAAPADEKHLTRRSQARIIGGYIATGEITESEATQALLSACRQNTDDYRAAEKTILSAIENGKKDPLQSDIKRPNTNKKAITQVEKLSKDQVKIIYQVTGQRLSNAGKNGGSPDAETARKDAAIYLKEIEGLEGPEVEKLVMKAEPAQAKPTFTTETLIKYIQSTYQFKRNEITGFITSKGNIYDVAMQNSIYLDCVIKFGKKDITKEFVDAIIVSNQTPNYNPFKDFYQANKHLPDEPQIIDEFITSITSSTKNSGPWIRKWLIALAESIEKINDENFYPRIMVVFCGGQNTGKTHWFRHLLPDGLARWYAESNLDKGKDDEILMCEKLIVSVDEYAGKTVQSDPEKLKRIISQKYFSLRRPYGKFNEDCKRLAVLAGTSNTTDILNDTTGNTRIIPINVLSIDHAIYNKYDKTHLLIQLIREVKKGETSTLTANDLKNLNDISQDHKEVSYEAEIVAKYFDVPSDDAKGQFYTTTDVLNTINLYSPTKIPDSKVIKIGKALTALFPQQKETAKKGEKRVRGYRLKMRAGVNVNLTSVNN